MTEIWKDVKEYEGLYQVSNLGNMKSLNYNNTGKPKELKQSITNYGYKFIELSKNGKRKHYRVHRLVAEHFLSNPKNYNIVNHKNRN